MDATAPGLFASVLAAMLATRVDANRLNWVISRPGFSSRGEQTEKAGSNFVCYENGYGIIAVSLYISVRFVAEHLCRLLKRLTTRLELSSLSWSSCLKHYFNCNLAQLPSSYALDEYYEAH